MYVYIYGTRTPEKDPAEVPVGSNSPRRENRRHDKQQASKQGGTPPQGSSKGGEGSQTFLCIKKVHRPVCPRHPREGSGEKTSKTNIGHQNRGRDAAICKEGPQTSSEKPSQRTWQSIPSIAGQDKQKQLPKRFASSEANRWRQQRATRNLRNRQARACQRGSHATAICREVPQTSSNAPTQCIPWQGKPSITGRVKKSSRRGSLHPKRTAAGSK